MYSHLCRHYVAEELPLTGVLWTRVPHKRSSLHGQLSEADMELSLSTAAKPMHDNLFSYPTITHLQFPSSVH